MARVDLTMSRGEQFKLADTITKNGAPYPTNPWTNHTVTFTARRKRGDAAPVIQKDSGAIGGVTLGGNGSGQYTVQILSADTAAFTEAELLEYEVTLLEPDSTKTVVAYGILRVDLSVS